MDRKIEQILSVYMKVLLDNGDECIVEIDGDQKRLHESSVEIISGYDRKLSAKIYLPSTGMRITQTEKQSDSDIESSESSWLDLFFEPR